MPGEAAAYAKASFINKLEVKYHNMHLDRMISHANQLRFRYDARKRKNNSEGRKELWKNKIKKGAKSIVRCIAL